jgi:cytochrome c-type biogenesis protein CcmE
VNKRAKQRLIGVTILIFVAVAAIIWFSGFTNATATPVSIEAVLADETLVGKQIEVTGQVVAGSWVSGAKPFVFEIEDSANEGSGRVSIVWNDVVPGSFGDGTTATVTGTITEDGSVEAKYLVTKCPSKYESATGALTVNDVINRATEFKGATVKVAGFVLAGSIGEPGAPIRFEIADSADGSTALPVSFGGGLSDEFAEGAKVVITGSLEADGIFQCTEVALDESAR